MIRTDASMKNEKAMVTLVIGESYTTSWLKFCEPNWKQYAERHGFDLICLDRPLDTSERARLRSASWQKCLILGQEFSKNYEQVVWVDSDIMINPNAPDITTGVPSDKVGAVEDTEYDDPAFLKRAYKFWPGAVINYTPQEYYSKYGLPADCDQVLNAGVLVLSPRFHRSILEHVYFTYEEKGGREWHMEMRPLSYELMKAGVVHWIDPRFNLMWPVEEIVHYPFLLPPPESPQGLLPRIKAKIRKIGQSSSVLNLRAACLNAVFQSSFFLHFGGMKVHEMELINLRPISWWDVLT